MNIEFTPFTHSASKSAHKNYERRELSNNKSAINIAIPQRPKHNDTHSNHVLHEASFGWSHNKRASESVFVDNDCEKMP